MDRTGQGGGQPLQVRVKSIERSDVERAIALHEISIAVLEKNPSASTDGTMTPAAEAECKRRGIAPLGPADMLLAPVWSRMLHGEEPCTCGADALSQARAMAAFLRKIVDRFPSGPAPAAAAPTRDAVLALISITQGYIGTLESRGLMDAPSWGPDSEPAIAVTEYFATVPKELAARTEGYTMEHVKDEMVAAGELNAIARNGALGPFYARILERARLKLLELEFAL